MLAMGPRDLNSAPYSPVHCSSHSMTSFQSSELTELPVVENGQLFAQRAHSARYAPIESRPPRMYPRHTEIGVEELWGKWTLGGTFDRRATVPSALCRRCEGGRLWGPGSLR